MADETKPPPPAPLPWSIRILLPSVFSGTLGGVVLGSFFGYLLAHPHRLLDALAVGALIGSALGFIGAWIGAAIIGVLERFR